MQPLIPFFVSIDFYGSIAYCFTLFDENWHYEKSHMWKPHYPGTKTQKTTHVQILCNYPPRNMMY